MTNNFAKGFNRQSETKIVGKLIIKNDRLDSIRENMYIIKKGEINKEAPKTATQVNHSTSLLKNIRGK